MVSLFVLATLGTLLADSLPQLPPARRAELERLLTPVDQVLNASKIPIAPSDAGCILLYERLALVDPAGRRTVIRQAAYKTLTDAGVQDDSEEVITYRKHDQKVYLLLAETIQPDGTRQPVKPDAVLIQTPQRQADYSLYDDEAELKIIYPNVKPGSVSHSIVVVEDEVAKLPNEYAETFNWGWSWPVGLSRYEVRLPPSLASRLTIDPIGDGVPRESKKKTAAGDTWFRWRNADQAATRYEIQSPPADQVGPSVHLSTMRSWDSIAAWYVGLVDGRNRLSPALTKTADAWVAKAKSDSERIAILHSKVADEVRYVGLEFGASDYQPHDCNSVWDNQYGDCKDKANLLVALLRHCGIKAYLALVNTEDPGLVDRTTPSYRVFSHAIVAVRSGQGNWLFCDPTIAYSTPGMLGSGSINRAVLVITEHGAKWVRTPAARAGGFAYHFDLKLGPTGELSGWLTFTSDGTYGAYERDAFSRLDADSTRSEMSKIVRGFYPGADLVDVKRKDSPVGTPYVLRSYFIVPNATASADGRLTLAFPSSRSLLADLGDRPDRKKTFTMANDRIEATATIELPGKYVPAKIPTPFQFDGPGGSFATHWSFNGSVCKTSIVVDTTATSLQPKSFATYYRASESLRSWLAQPVVLAPDTTTPVDIVATPQLDLPLMPTGDGELDLIDRRYPENGNRPMRRLALERTLQYFPKDAATVFRAGIGLSINDWDESHDQAAHDRARALLAAYSGRVSPVIYAWGLEMDGLILRDLGHPDDAARELTAVFNTTGADDVRRSGAAMYAATILESSQPDKALALLLKAAALPNGDTQAVETRILHLLLTMGKNDEVRQRLTAFIHTHPDSFEDTLTAIVGAARKWTAPEDEPRILALCDAVAAVVPSPGTTLANALADCRSFTIGRDIQRQLITDVSKEPFSDWLRPSDAIQGGDFQAYFTAIKKNSDPAHARTALSLSLTALTNLPVDANASRMLWLAAVNAEWIERLGSPAIDPALCSHLLDLCDKLPSSDAYFYEGKLLRASRCARTGDVASQQKILQEMLRSPSTPPIYRSASAAFLGESFESLKAYPEAIATYREAEPYVTQNRFAANAAFRAALIDLNQGNRDEAVRLLTLLAQVPETILRQTDAPAQIADLVHLVKSGHALESWKAADAWWSSWQRVAASQGLSLDARDLVVPVIPDLPSFDLRLAAAIQRNDASNVLPNVGLLLSAARWQPSLYTEMPSLCLIRRDALPNLRSDLIQVGSAMLAAPLPSGAFDKRQRQLLEASLDLARRDSKALATLIPTFDPGSWPFDGVAVRMLQVQALAALDSNSGRQAASTQLRDYLSAPHSDDDRLELVQTLARLYDSLGQKNEEIDLLDKEIKTPAFASNPGAIDALKKIRATLTPQADFAAAVHAWIKAAPLPWLPYAEPESLSDPRLTDLADALDNESIIFPVQADEVKLELLAADDADLPMNQRMEQFRHAIGLLITTSHDYARIRRFTDSVISDERFDRETRLDVIWDCLKILAMEGRKTDYATYRASVLCSHFNETYKQRLQQLDFFVNIDRSSSSAILEAARQFSQKPGPSYGRFLLTTLFFQLTNRLGDLKAARAFADSVPSWKLSLDTPSDVQRTQFTFSQNLHRAALINPVIDAMAKVMLEHCPTTPVHLPTEFADDRSDIPFQPRDKASTLAAFLYKIRSGSFDRNYLYFWHTLLRRLPADQNQIPTLLATLHAGISATQDDNLRFKIFSIFIGSADIDNPAIVSGIRNEIAQTDDPVRYPLCHSAGRYFDLVMAFRHGETRDPIERFSDVADSRYGLIVLTQARLHFFADRGDTASIDRCIDDTDSTVLLSPPLISTTLEALRVAGRTRQLKQAEAVATALQRKALVASWMLHYAGDAYTAISLAKALRKPALLPYDWLADLQQHGDPRVAHEGRYIKAALESRWSVVLDETSQAISIDSNYYEDYWYQGEALAKLGRKEEAIKALTVFTHYSKDSWDYRSAVDLLATLKKQERKGA